MKRSVGATILLAAFVSACGSPFAPAAVPANEAMPVSATGSAGPRILRVFAAASLTEAFEVIGKAFEAANPGVQINFNFAGSQTLRTQLEQGARADVFASANHTEMDTAVTDRLVRETAPRDFLTNRLVVILPAENAARVRALQDLARPGLKVVLADITVPVGKYARQVIDNMSKDTSYGTAFATRALANVVSNENDVKQVVAKIQLGEADAGIVYVSDAVAAPELKTIEIPDNLNVIAKYPIARLTQSAEPDLAAAFVAYVLSADGQATLEKWGFSPIR